MSNVDVNINYMPVASLKYLQNLYSVTLFLTGVWSLKCKCDYCTKTNFTCYTDGYCFTATEIKDGTVKYVYRWVSYVIFTI